MRRWWLIGLAVLTCVVGVWQLGRGKDVSSAPRSDVRGEDVVGNDAPLLVGRDPATRGDLDGAPDAEATATEPVRPNVVIRGRLVTADGGRLRKPRAYLVPKGSMGFRDWREVEARAEVEDDGSWSLEADPRGTWIAGLAAGYRPAFADGDTWNGEEVELELALGRRLEITVSVQADGVHPPLYAYVSERGDEGFEFPGPGSEPVVETSVVLDRTDRAPVYASMGGPIRVRVWAPDCVAEPAFVDLEREEHQADFRITLACSVVLERKDAETGYPVIGDGEVAAYAAGGRIEDARFHRLDDDSRYGGLLPGTYRIALKTPGYEPWRSDAIHLTRPGQQVELEARLEPLRGAGRLLLEVVPPEGGSLEGALFSILVGRRTSEGPLEWKRHAPRAMRDDRRHVLLTPLDAGEIHLLAWTGSVAVGWLGPLRVSGTETDTARLTLAPGTIVQLHTGAGGSPGAFYSGEVSATVRRSDGTALPLATFFSRQPPWPGQRLSFFSSHEGRDELLAVSITLSERAVLGPYPFTDLIVEGSRAELLPNTR